MICDLAQNRLKANASKSDYTEPKKVIIDGLVWLTFDARATISNMELQYRYFVYTDKEQTVQIVCWSSPRQFKRAAPIMDRIAQTFHFMDVGADKTKQK